MFVFTAALWLQLVSTIPNKRNNYPSLPEVVSAIENSHRGPLSSASREPSRGRSNINHQCPERFGQMLRVDSSKSTRSVLSHPIRCTEENIPDCRVHVYWQGCSPEMFTYRPEDFTLATKAFFDLYSSQYVLWYWFSCNENIQMFCL